MSSVRRPWGRLFQIRGPAVPKLLSPKLLRVRGTTHMLSKEDRRGCRLPKISIKNDNRSCNGVQIQKCFLFIFAQRTYAPNATINIYYRVRTGVGAQSTSGGGGGGGAQNFCRKKYIKNQQNAWILHDSCPKNYQNTQICMIFARKMPKFYIIIAPKIFFSQILRGHVPSLNQRLLRL